ncbi:energy transducer TonB [Fluviicola taffensis]|uniref:energy transducer TonB n=1 Tax=Fluviicola taffensis TaxID=191579 RepID=UPI0031382EA2
MNSSLTKSGFIFLLSFGCFQSFGQVNEPKSETPTIEPQQEPIYAFVEEPAEFPTGATGFFSYVKENLRYPENARKSKIEGKCFLQFVVQKDGSISDVKVKKGVPDCPECDAEAIRLLKSMPNWKPGVNNGEKVNSLFSIPVTFKL